MTAWPALSAAGPCGLFEQVNLPDGSASSPVLRVTAYPAATGSFDALTRLARPCRRRARLADPPGAASLDTAYETALGAFAAGELGKSGL